MCYSLANAVRHVLNCHPLNAQFKKLISHGVDAEARSSVTNKWTKRQQLLRWMTTVLYERVRSKGIGLCMLGAVPLLLLTENLPPQAILCTAV